MRSRIAIFTAALALTIGIAATAESKDTGTVVRLDFPANVVMLDGGRMYRMTPSTVLLVDNRTVSFKALQPGARVTIQDGEPVMYRDRKYIALKPVPAPTVAQTPPPVTEPPAPARVSEAPVPPPARVTDAPAPAAVAEAPAPRAMSVEAAVAAAPGAVTPSTEATTKEASPNAESPAVRRTVYGTVTDIDGDGTLTIKTDNDSFEARVGKDALRDINKGDTVVIELSVSPPGSASPR